MDQPPSVTDQVKHPQQSPGFFSAKPSVFHVDASAACAPMARELPDSPPAIACPTTACYGSEEGQFPADNLFAAAGQGIWDNGASCGREYLVRCLSSATPDACAQGRTIHVVILDEAAALNSMPSTNGTTMVLSTTAFRMITQHSVDVINIEFTQ
uniref:EG45-like domain containing protein 1 n=1 Tax=Elaeis guineensis var. tenera TaxID=51953 RepID=A0A6J0PL35_ELAGV|nr:putative EG45-like domain containing protein 1 [Elaeis guineensis]